MLNSKKAVLTQSLWEVVELMLAGIILVLVIWIVYMGYNAFIAGPADEAKAENAFNALYAGIEELMASKLPFKTTTIGIQLPENYVIVFFNKNKNVDTCRRYTKAFAEKLSQPWQDSIVKAHCEPPCMCYYKISGESREFFEENNDPDHKKCEPLPKAITDIATWDSEYLTRFYAGTKDEVFTKNIKGTVTAIQDYPKFPLDFPYSQVFIYGQCDTAGRMMKEKHLKFGIQTIYLEKAEYKKKTAIFITGKTDLTNARESGMLSQLKLQELSQNE